MHKIATSRELQAELQRILLLAQEPNPSRARLAEELHTLADALVEAKGNFKQHGKDEWFARVQYAGGETHDWGIKQVGEGKFKVEVRTKDGIQQANKDFSDLAAAERFADKFIEKAHGWELLEKALPKDFHKVH